MTVARRFIISGLVQGVGYRYFVLRAAARHQVLGTVRNLPDERVEVIAEGERLGANGVSSRGLPMAKARARCGRRFRISRDKPLAP